MFYNLLLKVEPINNYKSLASILYIYKTTSSSSA